MAHQLQSSNGIATQKLSSDSLMNDEKVRWRAVKGCIDSKLIIGN